MKNGRLNLKLIIAIIATALATAITVIVTVIVINSGDFGIKSLTVNGVNAIITEDAITVDIPQTKSISINTELNDPNAVIKYYSDKSEQDKISNIANIDIGGCDVVIYITVGKNETVKKRYTLYIKNQILQEPDISLTINGNDFSESNGMFEILLPFGNRQITLSDIELPEFFSYALYSDFDRTNQIEPGESFILPNDQDQLYLDIYNDKNTTLYKSYRIKFNFIKSAENRLLTFSINNSNAIISDQTATVNIDRTDNYSIAATSSDKSEISIYYDSENSQMVTDFTSVSLNNSKQSNKLYVAVTAENGTVSHYTITVDFNKEPDNDILMLKVNDIAAEISENTATVVLPRTTLYRMALSVSEYASFVVFYDENMTLKIDDLSAIDEVNRTEKESKLFIKVTAENGDTKLYTVIFRYILNEDISISSVNVNGITADIADRSISVLIDRCKQLNIKTVCSSPSATSTVFSDAECNNGLNAENIDISDYSSNKYRAFIRVTAESGKTAVYTLTVNFNPAKDAELLDLRANNSALAFTDNSVDIEYEGTIQSFTFKIQYIKVSDYATYAIFKDSGCTEPISNIENITLDQAVQSLYIKVIAENGDSNIYCINITLISNDNELKMICINGQESIIKSEYSEITIESSHIVSVDEIRTDANADVSVFYDISQTNPVKDLHNINYKDNRAELFVRIVAENSEIKVYHLIINIKYFPIIDFPISSVQLEEWQTALALNELFEINGNSYTNNQFEINVYWDSTKINTDNIQVDNEDKYHELEIIVSSQYFATFSAHKTIRILPYTLRPVQAVLVNDIYHITDTDNIFVLSDFITLDTGSYTLGTDYYIEFNNASNTKIVMSSDAEFSLNEGNYKIFINSFKHDFEPISVGTINVALSQKITPTISAPNYLEYKVSENIIILKDLFEITANDYDIILIKTFVNEIEADTLECSAGIYTIKLQAYYSDGVIEKTLEIQIAEQSDNTDIDVSVNGVPVQFTDNIAVLPHISYSDSFLMTVNTLSANASSVIYLNDVVTDASAVILKEGENSIRIIVTAESGITAEYTLTVTKEARKLPEIIAEDITVRLTKNNYKLELGDKFTVKENDYTGTLKMFFNGMEIDNTTVEVENVNSIYTVKIQFEGEFGIVTKEFEIGVLQYEQIEIIFNKNKLETSDVNYVFTYLDFIFEIDYYGINESDCELKLLCNNEPFSASALSTGTYYITAQIWKEGSLIAEQSTWFLIDHGDLASAISVSLKSAEMIITENPSVKALEDCFDVDYADYNSNQLRIVYLFENTDKPSYDITLKNGDNNFTLLISDIVTGEELFKQRFGIKCTYIPLSSRVFKNLYINDNPVTINGNKVVLYNYAISQPIKLEYELNESFTVHKIQSEIELHNGINAVDYSAEENEFIFNGLLEIYLIYDISNYITSINYDNIIAVDNKIILDADTNVDIHNLVINLNESEHITTSLSIKSERNDVYEILIYGYYDGFAIGNTFVQLYVGSAPPRLIDIIDNVNADGLIFTNIGDYALTMYIVSNVKELSVGINFIDNKYSAELNLGSLQIGHNNASLTVQNNANNEYEYTVNIYLFPVDFINTINYQDEVLQKSGNKYLCNVTTLNIEFIDIVYENELNCYNLTEEKSEVLFNGDIIGIEYILRFNSIKIYEFGITINNSNVAVEVYSVNNQALQQIGDSTFTDSITIEHNNSDATSVLYILNTIYPYSVIIGSNLDYDEDIGYLLSLDMSEYTIKESGTYMFEYAFVVRAINGDEKAYKLSLSITVFERSEQTAALTIILNDEYQVYIMENELDVGNIFVQDSVPLKIECEAITVRLKNDLGYSLYDQHIAVSNLNVKRQFVNGRYIIEFSIGLNEVYLKNVRINIAEFVTSDGAIIETACSVSDQLIYVLKNAETEIITYENKDYNVRIAQNKLILTEKIDKIEIKYLGIMLEYGEFIFDNGTSGKSGFVNIQNDKILIIYKEGDLIIPYALIYVEYNLQEAA